MTVIERSDLSVSIGIDAAVVADHQVAIRGPGMRDDFRVSPTLTGMAQLTERLTAQTTRFDSSLPFELSRRDLAFVFLNRVGAFVDAPSVSAGNVGGSRAAGELLIRLGHTRLGANFGLPTPAPLATAKPDFAARSTKPVSRCRETCCSDVTTTRRAGDSRWIYNYNQWGLKE